MKQGDIDELKGLVFDLTEKLEESSRHASEAILEKDKEIKHLIAKYKPYEKFLVNKTKDEVVRTIQKSEIVHKLFFDSTHPVHLPSKEDWNMLEQLFSQCHPNFSLTLQEQFKLTSIEYKVCQLTYVGIPPKGIAVLKGFDKSYSTHIRKRMLAKLTGKDGKAADLTQFLRSIPLA